MYCCAWRRNLTNGRFPTNQNVWATTEILHEILGAVFDQCTQGAGKLEPFYNTPCCLSDGRELPAGCIYLKFFPTLEKPRKTTRRKRWLFGDSQKMYAAENPKFSAEIAGKQSFFCFGKYSSELVKKAVWAGTVWNLGQRCPCTVLPLHQRESGAIPHKERLATLHAICLQISRHISQKCS